MDAEKQPLLFANRVIRHFTDNLIGDDRVLLPADYLTIRTAFRYAKGSWERLIDGNMAQHLLLEEIIKTWGAVAKGKDSVELV